jgi:hypothetical protein
VDAYGILHVVAAAGSVSLRLSADRFARRLIFRIRVKPVRDKYFAFSESQISRMVAPSRARFRGALRDRHERWLRDAMDAAASPDE